MQCLLNWPVFSGLLPLNAASHGSPSIASFSLNSLPEVCLCSLVAVVACLSVAVLELAGQDRMTLVNAIVIR